MVILQGSSISIFNPLPHLHSIFLFFILHCFFFLYSILLQPHHKLLLLQHKLSTFNQNLHSATVSTSTAGIFIVLFPFLQTETVTTPIPRRKPPSPNSKLHSQTFNHYESVTVTFNRFQSSLFNSSTLIYHHHNRTAKDPAKILQQFSPFSEVISRRKKKK